VVTVRLFGEIGVTGDGVTVPDGRPARSLLVWLCLHPGRQPRSVAASRLWPDVGAESARQSLRAALSALRSAIGADAVAADRDQIGLTGCDVDVQRFDGLLRDGRAAEAVVLYGGDLAPGVEGEWAEEARLRYRDRAGRAWAGLADEAERSGDLAAAIAHASARAALDPLAEPAQREVIRLRWLAGDRSGALAGYDRLAERLRSELRVAPSPETRELVAALRRDVPTAELGGAVPHVPLPPAVVRAASEPLAGRADALAEARSSLDAVRGQGAHLLLVAGEPGIGKTRLAAELATFAHREGANVLAGRAQEDALAPYQAWAEALAGLAASLDATTLDAAFGPEAAEIARIVPSLQARLGDRHAAPADAEGARYRLFEAVGEVMARLAHARPVVVLFDDLHWAEQPSLLLLAHLLRRPGLDRTLVIGTYRESALDRAHPLARLLADLRRDDAVRRIRLQGLPADALALLDPSADPELVGRVLDRTGGNPFFARELFRHAAETGGVGLPEGVREVIGERASRLSETANEALAAAAVVGARFDIAVVEELLGHDALPALEEATAAGLIREEPGLPGRFAFAHALVQETLYAELSTLRRVRLHQAAADALAARGGDLPEVARHRFEAAAGDPAAAVDAAIAAGDAAMTALAYEAAAAQYERALQALGEGGPRRCDLLVALGEALARAGEAEASRPVLDAAIEEARTADDPVRLARATLARSGVAIVILDIDRDEINRLERALEALGDRDDALRAGLLGRLAIATYYEQQPERRRSLAADAVDAASRAGGVRGLAQALAAQRIADWGPDDLDRRLATDDRLIRLGTDGGDVEAELQGRHWRIVDLVEAGAPSALREEVEAYGTLAERARLPQHRWYARFWQALRAELAGDGDAGAPLLAEAAAIADRAADPNAGRAIDALELTRRLIRGDDAADFAHLVETVIVHEIQKPHVGPAFRAGYAWYLAASGDLPGAREQLRIGGPPAELPRDVNWFSTMAERAVAIALLGDGGIASEHYPLLEPLAGRQAIVARAWSTYGAVDYFLGILAGTMGDPIRARSHLTDAVRLDEAFGGLLAARRAQHALEELG
jgi:DNA-binding SARP family transcriptional activator